MNSIPFLDFSKRNADVKAKIIDAFEDFFDSGWYVLGERLSNFESQYALYMKSQYCVGVSTGLDALKLSLEALGVGAGDEVIVPSNTYIATVLAVTSLGATPIFVEPNIETYNIDCNEIIKSISPNTRAIIPVHLYGQSCEMNNIMSIALQHNLYVVEDNAQAQGAQFKGKYTGSFGHVNAVSFYPGKNLGALGEAGAITTDDEVISKKVKALRNYGSEQKYINKYRGHNNRMDELQGAVLSVMLEHLKGWNIERSEIAEAYSRELSGIDNIILPQICENATSVWHQFVIRTSERDELQDYLADNGVGTLIHYPIPPHLQECYKELGYKKGDFPIAEELASTSLSLPIYPGLSMKKVGHITKLLRDFGNNS